MSQHKLWIHSAKQIVQVVNDNKKVLSGDEMKNVAVLQDEDVTYSLVVDRDGRIADISTTAQIKVKYAADSFDKVINASGKTIIPGFVDGHTHPVWVGDRVHEFAMKLAGASYMEVHAAGGGIMFTVDKVRSATDEELFKEFKNIAKKMLTAGTTLAECKSGYGLDTETEVKMLKVLERARNDKTIPIDISATYCGGHAVPKDSTAEEATRNIVEYQIPAIEFLMKNNVLHADNIDVFCEKGVFDVTQTREILETGVKAGMAINFHGEELHRLNSAEMGADLGARAISHLEEISDEGIEALSKSGTIGVVLPTTAYILRLNPPPVRKMIEKGMAVALGSDFNPNAHCLAMPIVMHLACVTLRMSMPEVLVAATINAAASLGKSDTHGSIEVGKLADIVVINAPRWEHIVYQFGSYHHLIDYVVKAGNIVHTKLP